MAQPAPSPAPDISPIRRYLTAIHERFRGLEGGEVATYIPELATADPSWFGISIATSDGYVYEVGDTRLPFTIQSISKPLVYGLALEDRGKPAVLERVGVEPTGDAFNEISLESQTGRPRNPMINAGAITSTSLVIGESLEDRWQRILALLSMYAGRSLELNETVYRSERDTGHRNRAISHMLRNFEIIERDPEPDLDLYFRQCSTEVTCRDLSLMAATLATGGVNPLTRERVLQPSNVDEVLSVMTTCGMYDYAGEWVYRVGLPAKSGVAGGILAVLPGQLGIGIYSPPLDERGNSVRGVAVCEALSDELELHFLRAPRPAVSAIRTRFSAREVGSKRVRTRDEDELLNKFGHRAVIYQLQGDLPFAGMEIVIRRLETEHDDVNELVLDFTRVTDIDEPASEMLLELSRTFCEQGRSLVFVGLIRHPRLLRRLEEENAETLSKRIQLFDELDLAVEWAEDKLLEEHGSPDRTREELPFEQHEMLRGLERDEIEKVRSAMERRSYGPRDFVVRKGDVASEVFFVVQGELSVYSDTSEGRLRRLSTISTGMVFGEPSVLEDAVRTAFVRADQPSICWVLGREEFKSLAPENPNIKIHLLQNLLRSATKTVGRLSYDVLAQQL